MVKHTFMFRTDEQPVIGAAWALMANNDKVWYLPKRGIELGVFHHGWVDNSEILRDSSSSLLFQKNTLEQWSGYKEHHNELMSWKEYLHATNVSGWDKLCSNAPTKGDELRTVYTGQVVGSLSE